MKAEITWVIIDPYGYTIQALYLNGECVVSGNDHLEDMSGRLNGWLDSLVHRGHDGMYVVATLEGVAGEVFATETKFFPQDIDNLPWDDMSTDTYNHQIPESLRHHEGH